MTSSHPQQGALQQPQNNLDRYVVMHVATTCDEHGVYVTKDSAEVIEFGWILIDAKTHEEVTDAEASSNANHLFIAILITLGG